MVMMTAILLKYRNQFELGYVTKEYVSRQDRKVQDPVSFWCQRESLFFIWQFCYLPCEPHSWVAVAMK